MFEYALPRAVYDVRPYLSAKGGFLSAAPPAESTERQRRLEAEARNTELEKQAGARAAWSHATGRTRLVMLPCRGRNLHRGCGAGEGRAR